MTAPSDDERAVACPQCDVAPGEPCELPNGEPRPSGPHARRVKAAERNAREVTRALEEARKRAEAETPSRIRTKRFRRLWAACRVELEQRGDWTVLAREEVESLVLNMELAADCRAAIKSPSDLLVKGSTGQAVPNPMLATALKLDGQALITARELKLTPNTRGTSATTPDDGAIDDAEDRPAVELDELAELDQLAARRKAKSGGKR